MTKRKTNIVTYNKYSNYSNKYNKYFNYSNIYIIKTKSSRLQ